MSRRSTGCHGSIEARLLAVIEKAQCRNPRLRVRINSRPDCRKREVFVFDLTGMSWSCRIAVTAMFCSLGACGSGGGTPSMYSVGGTLSGLYASRKSLLCFRNNFGYW
jgi:hypothetical protein